MAAFKCKMCGGDLIIDKGSTVAECEYCGSKQTLPKLDDDRRANLYDRANHFRRNNEFDKAAGIYEQILNEDTTDAEAYWSLVLCRYGIEYVEDPATRKRVPTVNRAQFTSIFDDDNYRSALQYADGYQRSIYEAEANAINEIQKGILAISQKEEPFDVFICYKETDASGRRTMDSVLANDLYHQLTQEGFKVFFSRITLEDKLGTAYEPYIFAALNSAKVMVVLGTKPEHFNAVWVKNEWSRYLALVKQSGGKKVLIPAYRDMDPYDLPDEFSHLQAQDMSKLGFMQDLIRGIKKITAKEELKPQTVVQQTVVQQAAPSAAPSVEPLLRRAFMYLEDGEWQSADEYAEKVLDQDPENSKAYLAKLMAELKVRKKENLPNCPLPFNESNNYKKAVRFGDDKLRDELNGYIKHINERNENTRLTGIYNNGVTAMKAAGSESSYKAAAATFKTIPGFKDADSLAEQCLERAEVCRKDAVYASAKSQMTGNAVSGYEAAIKTFSTISGWKDADEQIYACQRKIEEIKAKEEADRLERERKEEADRLERERQAEQKRIAAEKAAKKRKRTFAIVTPIVAVCLAFVILLTTFIIPNSKYNAAVKLYDTGKYDEAITAFSELNGYKDSEQKITNCKYSIALSLLDSGEYESAYKLLEEIGSNGAIAESKYDRAVAFMDAGDYESAYLLLNGLNYKDSAERITAIKDIKYNAAVELLNGGMYGEAITALTALNGYKDSSDLLKEAKYNYALDLYNKGQYDEAIATFTSLSDYKDSQAQIENCNIGKYGERYRLSKMNLQVGDTFVFGAYDQDGNSSNGDEDIQWIVLAKKGDKILAVSKYIIDWREFQPGSAVLYYSQWKSCSLRSWLNITFLNKAFSSDEAEIIETSDVETDGETTKDKLFLLSYEEAKKYFSSDSARKCTGYKGTSTSIWTLRTTKYDHLWVYSVNSDGTLETSGRGFKAKLGIRPAMWIDLGL